MDETSESPVLETEPVSVADIPDPIEIIAEVPEPVAETLAEAPEPVSPVSETVAEAPEPVAETAAEVPEPVAETAAEVPEPVAETVAEVPEPVSEVETPVAADPNDASGSVKSVEHALAQLERLASKLDTKLSDSIQKIGLKLESAVTDLPIERKINETVDRILEAVMNKVSEAADNLDTQIDSAVLHAGGKLEVDLDNALKQIDSRLTDAAAFAETTVQAKVTSLDVKSCCLVS